MVTRSTDLARPLRNLTSKLDRICMYEYSRLQVQTHIILYIFVLKSESCVYKATNPGPKLGLTYVHVYCFTLREE